MKPVPWYKAPIVWLGIGITLLVLIGCIHMILLGHRLNDFEQAPVPKNQDNKAFTHILGMPLSKADSADKKATEGEQAPSHQEGL
ncbi:MAG TPA: hypothetical protein VK099_03420 [Alcanivoracaceae bacterium]|nr:hypothetical protein [Alcanivoracaceae bacterium]